MRVSIVHRHFWPEALTYALMLRDISAALRADGHEVTVISVKSEHSSAEQDRTQMPGVRVLRIPLLAERRDTWGRRLLNTGWYLVSMTVLLACQRGIDVIVVATTPPVLPAWLVAVVSRIKGARFVYHYQDLHPESLATVGAIRNARAVRLLRSMDDWSSRRAARRVVLSRDMGEALVARSGRAALDYHVINNFDPTEDAVQGGEGGAVRLPGTGLRLLFAGNLGLFQGLEQLVRAMTRIGEQTRFSLVFVGDGALKDKLKRDAGALLDRTIYFLDRCSPNRAKAFMQAADYGVVSLSPNVIRYAYPSKVMSYLSAGLPLLAVVEDDSELAQLVREERIGVSCAPDDIEALSQMLVGLPGRTTNREACRSRCQAVARERFARRDVLARWQVLVGEMT